MRPLYEKWTLGQGELEKKLRRHFDITGIDFRDFLIFEVNIPYNATRLSIEFSLTKLYIFYCSGSFYRQQGCNGCTHTITVDIDDFIFLWTIRNYNTTSIWVTSDSNRLTFTILFLTECCINRCYNSLLYLVYTDNRCFRFRTSCNS